MKGSTTKKESGGIFGWLASKAKAFFDRVKKAISAAINFARKAIKAAIDLAKKAAVGLIEVACKVAVAAIKAAVLSEHLETFQDQGSDSGFG